MLLLQFSFIAFGIKLRRECYLFTESLASYIFLSGTKLFYKSLLHLLWIVYTCNGHSWAGKKSVITHKQYSHLGIFLQSPFEAVAAANALNHPAEEYVNDVSWRPVTIRDTVIAECKPTKPDGLLMTSVFNGIILFQEKIELAWAIQAYDYAEIHFDVSTLFCYVSFSHGVKYL